MAQRRKRIPDPRPSWDEYFMGIADVVSRRANCSRRKVAAVIVKDNHILSTGYNGTPRGVENCFSGGCARCAGKTPSGKNLEECRCVHAEQNAICQAAYYGVSTAGATIYITISPCLTCAKLIINAGIREVVYGGDYAFGEDVKEMFNEAGVKFRKYEKEN
ncbi:MAG: cytidine/deoxycytidylate deaminase family protein [Kiritimatiellae bacterium]|nr:cytidine/deoxycytidylate deaminase family protein [Kiritimatiellia bacterium]